MLEIIRNKDKWPKIGLVRFIFYTAFIIFVSGTGVWGFDQLSTPSDFVFFVLMIVSFVLGYFSLMVLFAIRAKSIGHNPLFITVIMLVLFLLAFVSLSLVVLVGLILVLAMYVVCYALVDLTLFYNKPSEKPDTPNIQNKEKSSLFLQRLRRPILLFTLAIILTISFLLTELDLGMDKGLTLDSIGGCLRF